MPSLQEWLNAATDLDAIYQAELGRSVFSDPQAFVNWAYWRLDRGTSLEEITEAIRKSPEWIERHGGPAGPTGPPLTHGILRVTDAQDGTLLNRTYSYWPNAVVINGRALAFVGHADGRPRFFSVDLATGVVDRLGPLLSYHGTGEGLYFDADGLIYLCEGPRLRRVNLFTGDDTEVLDISDAHPGCILWQAHSSEDGLAHSATVKRVVSDGPYQAIGTVAVHHGTRHFFGAQGSLDESQIDASGRYLVIKEDDDNRIIDLQTGHETRIANADGAMGHSDCGHGFIVGEDDQIGACVRMNLSDVSDRTVLFGTWNMGHVSVRAGRCLLSDAAHLSLVGLDGSGVTRLLEHGMVGSGYDFQVHANLSPCGRVASYVSNAAGRFDLYLAVLP